MPITRREFCRSTATVALGLAFIGASSLPPFNIAAQAAETVPMAELLKPDALPDMILGDDKAPVSSPRRAMGHLLGNAVRFGRAVDVLAAGEGIETMLSLRQIAPDLPMAAALSANHLAALRLPPTLRRLYIAADEDPAGDRAKGTLAERAEALGIEVATLEPVRGDFNDDLRRLGRAALAARVRIQLKADDAALFCGR